MYVCEAIEILLFAPLQSSSSSSSPSSSVCSMTLDDVAQAIDQLRTAAASAASSPRDALDGGGCAGPLYIFLVGWSEAASPLLEYAIASGEAVRADGMMCISHSLSSTFPLLSQSTECAPLPVPYYTPTLSRLTSGPARLMLLLIRLQLIADGLFARVSQRGHRDNERQERVAPFPALGQPLPRRPRQRRWSSLTGALREFQEVREEVNRAFSQIDRVSMLWAQQQDASSQSHLTSSRGGKESVASSLLREEGRTEHRWASANMGPHHATRPLVLSAVSGVEAPRQAPNSTVVWPLQPNRLADQAPVMCREVLMYSPAVAEKEKAEAEAEEHGPQVEGGAMTAVMSRQRTEQFLPIPAQCLTAPTTTTSSSNNNVVKRWERYGSADDVVTSCMLQGWSPSHPTAATAARPSFPPWIGSPSGTPLRGALWSPISRCPSMSELANGGNYVSWNERFASTPPTLSAIDAGERAPTRPGSTTPVVGPFLQPPFECPSAAVPVVDTGSEEAAVVRQMEAVHRRPSVLYAMAEGRPGAAESLVRVPAEVPSISEDWTAKATALLQLRVRSAQHAALVDRIAIPTLLLHARDDPVVPPSSIPFSLLQRNANITTVLTRRGSHATFAEGLSTMWTRPQLIIEEDNEGDSRVKRASVQRNAPHPCNANMNSAASRDTVDSGGNEGNNRRRREDASAVTSPESLVRVRISGTTWMEQLLLEYIASAVLSQPAKSL